MRIWLAKHNFLLAIIAITVVAFVLGWYAGSNATGQKAYAALWAAMINLPDPEQCALCGEGIPYHAPCLVDLSTGQMGELTVYTPHPSRQGEITPMEMQPTGTFYFQSCAGLVAIRDTCAHTCQVTLPAEREPINPAFFCTACRQLLAGAGLDGYVIADLHDLDNIQAHSIQRGMDKVIRDYRVSVTGRQGAALDVCVTGLL